MNPQDIINDPRELWMNSPVGYPFAERIEKGDINRLKSFLINISGQDDMIAEQIRQSSHAEIIKMLLDSNFTFDSQWLGARDIPKRSDGTHVSVLDDPEWRASSNRRIII